MEIISKIIKGNVNSESKEQIRLALRLLEDKYAKITIKESKKLNSLSQKGYYFAAVIPPIQEMLIDLGNNVDSEDVHSFLKHEAGKLTKYIRLPNDEVKPIPGSIAGMNTKEFEKYLEKVRMWAAQTLDLIIPLPNERLEGEEE